MGLRVAKSPVFGAFLQAKLQTVAITAHHKYHVCVLWLSEHDTHKLGLILYEYVNSERTSMMTAAARVALVVDNTRTQKQRSKRKAPTQSFLTDKHPIYGGKAEIVRTQQSGGYWHFRMWISEESKYVRKTLKTKHLDTAVERAENEFFAIKANLNSGKRIFSPTVQQAAEDYLKHRWEVDVKRGSITEGRWGTIKSQLNHFVAYCGIVGRSERSSVTRLSDLESKSLQGY